MQAVRGHIGALLVMTEQRSLRFAAAVGLLLVLGVSVLVPAGGSPPGGSAPSGSDPAPVVPVVAKVPPKPTPSDVQSTAVDRLARAGIAVRKGGPQRRLAALTFDDGPGPFTERVVAELQRLHAPGTFFQVGRVMDDFPQAAARVAGQPGAVIGDHTFNHAALSHLDRAGQVREIVGGEAAMRAHGELVPRLMRPPYGLWNADTIGVTKKRGLLVTLWSVDSRDYMRPGVDAIVRTVMSETRPGAIILMHDAGGDRTQTLAALPKIVRKLRRRGYGLVTVPELMAKDPPRREDEARPGQVIEGESGAG